MGFYDDEENVEAYVQMAEGYDGRDLVAALRQHLPPGRRFWNWAWGRERTWRCLR